MPFGCRRPVPVAIRHLRLKLSLTEGEVLANGCSVFKVHTELIGSREKHFSYVSSLKRDFLTLNEENLQKIHNLEFHSASNWVRSRSSAL